MDYLTKDQARKLAIADPRIMSVFKAGYSETLRLTNNKVMNDSLVKPNDYFVNPGFATDPKAFVAHYADRIYRVLRVIYVDPSHRSAGLGSELVRSIQAYSFAEAFLQVGVEVTNDGRYARLDKFYKGLGFKAAPQPVDHGNGHAYRDYFWARREFAVQQQGSLIAPYLL